MIAKRGDPGIEDVTLRPGEFHFGGGATRVHTLLGSCVAITLWHPEKHIGGMCHYLLPQRGSCQRLTRGHYADEAMDLFLQEIRSACTRPGEYQVKLFGGGNMFERSCKADASINVSRKNIEAGINLLQQHGFTVVAQDVGGNRYRRIYLELWSGDVWVHRGAADNTQGPMDLCPR